MKEFFNGIMVFFNERAVPFIQEHLILAVICALSLVAILLFFVIVGIRNSAKKAKEDIVDETAEKEQDSEQLVTEPAVSEVKEGAVEEVETAIEDVAVEEVETTVEEKVEIIEEPTPVVEESVEKLAVEEVKEEPKEVLPAKKRTYTKRNTNATSKGSAPVVKDATTATKSTATKKTTKKTSSRTKEVTVITTDKDGNKVKKVVKIVSSTKRKPTSSKPATPKQSVSQEKPE